MKDKESRKEMSQKDGQTADKQSTFNIQHSIFNIQYSTFNNQRKLATRLSD